MFLLFVSTLEFFTSILMLLYNIILNKQVAVMECTKKQDELEESECEEAPEKPHKRPRKVSSVNHN